MAHVNARHEQRPAKLLRKLAALIRLRPGTAGVGPRRVDLAAQVRAVVVLADDGRAIVLRHLLCCELLLEDPLA
eukprot:490668-Karenia_brevis.AAC.1